MAIGIYLVIVGSLEVYDTQHNIVDQNTVLLSPTGELPFCTSYPNPCRGNPHVYAIFTIFKTNDIFAVNNRIDGDVVVTVNDPRNINQTIGVVLTKKSDTSWMNNQTELREQIKFYFANNLAFKGTANEYSYKLPFHYVASSDEGETIWVFVQTIDGKWFSYNGLDFPTIAPAGAWIELKNSRIIEGLTWVIVGFIPVGLVAEFFILYVIERHFSEKGTAKPSPSTTDDSCPFNSF